MKSQATTVKQYLRELPEDRRVAMVAVRDVIVKNLPKGYVEGVQYGAIGYFVPHSIYPNGYHCDPKQPLPFAGLASQKHHMGVYLMCIYDDEAHADWFREAWAKTGKKLDMGKSCVRFKKLDDVALNVIGQAVKRVPVKKFIARYEATLAAMKSRRIKASAPAKKATKKTTAKKRVPKKRVAKKVAATSRKRVSKRKSPKKRAS